MVLRGYCKNRRKSKVKEVVVLCSWLSKNVRKTRLLILTILIFYNVFLIKKLHPAIQADYIIRVFFKVQKYSQIYHLF
jgi:hypothetical protein